MCPIDSPLKLFTYQTRPIAADAKVTPTIRVLPCSVTRVVTTAPPSLDSALTAAITVAVSLGGVAQSTARGRQAERRRCQGREWEGACKREVAAPIHGRRLRTPDACRAVTRGNQIPPSWRRGGFTRVHTNPGVCRSRRGGGGGRGGGRSSLSRRLTEMIPCLRCKRKEALEIGVPL